MPFEELIPAQDPILGYLLEKYLNLCRYLGFPDTSKLAPLIADLKISL